MDRDPMDVKTQDSAYTAEMNDERKKNNKTEKKVLFNLNRFKMNIFELRATRKEKSLFVFVLTAYMDLISYIFVFCM